MSYKLWTMQELRTLKENRHLHACQIQTLLPHRTEHAIRNKIAVMGLNRSYNGETIHRAAVYRVYDPDSGELLAEGSTRQCAQQLGVTRKVVDYHANHEYQSRNGKPSTRWRIERIDM